MVFAVLGVVGGRATEVGSDGEDDLSSESGVGDLCPHQIDSLEQRSHQRNVTSVVVSVRVKATDRQVGSNRQSGLEASDGNHRLTLQAVPCRIDRRLGGKCSSQRRQIIGRITRQIQLCLTAMQSRNLRSITQRHQAISLHLIDAIPRLFGVIQRRRTRGISTVRIGNALRRIDVAKARKRGQSSGRLIASVRDKPERISRRLGRSEHCTKARIAFRNATAPDHARSGVVVARRGVDSVYHQQVVFVLGDEVERLHSTCAKIDGGGWRPKLSDLRDFGPLKHPVDVDRAIASFRIAKVGRIPTTTGVDHDEVRTSVTRSCRIRRTTERGRSHHSDPAGGGEL